MKQCECGCGEMFVRAARKGAPHRYIPGHQFRQSWVREAVKKTVAERKIVPPSDYPTHGFCLCGCGGRTSISPYTCQTRGMYAGLPRKYIFNHRPVPSGQANPLFKGRQTYNGYVLVYAPDHPGAFKARGSRCGYVLEHRLVWEQANGRRLNPSEHVHHINGQKSDNRPENLVAVSRSEHRRIHRPGDNITDETRRKLSEATRKAHVEGRIHRRKPSPTE